MSYADQIYIWNLNDVIHNGSKEVGNVRPHWPDGAPAPTIRVFDTVNKYDLSKEFPILTCRPVNIQKAADEMIWIYSKKSSNIHDLNSHIWDAWADETGSVGKTYGYQAGKKYQWREGFSDQVDHALYMIQNDPMSRHIIIDLWNPADYMDMHLAPCCCKLQFNVDGEKLNMVLYQRSWDLIAAGGWDVTAHSLLLMMFARHCGLKPGVFTHFISNMHIYDRHIPIAEEFVTASKDDSMAQYAKGDSRTTIFGDAPKVAFRDRAPTNFYDITPEDFVFLTPYNPLRPKLDYEVAV